MKKLIETLILLIAVVAFQHSDFALHTYGVPGQTLNGGVVVGDCYHWDAGFEAWGQRGFFVDQC